jgi:hypothetical protein
MITTPPAIADNAHLATRSGRCSLCKFSRINPGDRIARLIATGEWCHIACIAALSDSQPPA